MKKYFSHFLIFAFGVGSILFIWSGTINQTLHQSDTLNSESDNGYVVNVESGLDYDFTHQDPFVRETDNPTHVNGPGFKLVIPEDWSLDGFDGYEQDVMDGFYGSISFGTAQDDAFLSDDGVVLDISSFLRPDNLKKEISDRKMVSEEVRGLMVEYFLSENPDVGLMETDVILFDDSQNNIGAFPVYRTGFKCLKSCYPEGLPPTRFSYFIDAGENIYQFDVFMNTSKNTDSLLKKAEEIIWSFSLLK